MIATSNNNNNHNERGRKIVVAVVVFFCPVSSSSFSFGSCYRSSHRVSNMNLYFMSAERGHQAMRPWGHEMSPSVVCMKSFFLHTNSVRLQHIHRSAHPPHPPSTSTSIYCIHFVPFSLLLGFEQITGSQRKPAQFKSIRLDWREYITQSCVTRKRYSYVCFNKCVFSSCTFSLKILLQAFFFPSFRSFSF